MTSEKYTPLFKDAEGNVFFLPYLHLVADTKGKARRIGHKMHRQFHNELGLDYCGRALRLGDEEYARVPWKYAVNIFDGNPMRDDRGNYIPEIWVCPVEGAIFQRVKWEQEFLKSISDGATGAEGAMEIANTK